MDAGVESSSDSFLVLNATDVVSILRCQQAMKDEYYLSLSNNARIIDELHEHMYLLDGSNQQLESELEAMRAMSCYMRVDDDDVVHYHLNEVKVGICSVSSECLAKSLRCEERLEGILSEPYNGTLDRGDVNLLCFSRILGLSITSESRTLTFHFKRTAIGEACHHAQIALQITNRTVKGISCFPAIHTFEHLIEGINRGLELGRFLCVMRSSFGM